MQKITACLPQIGVAALNGAMCWGINQLPGKTDLKESNLNIPTEMFVGITIVTFILIGILSSRSISSSTPAGYLLTNLIHYVS